MRPLDLFYVDLVTRSWIAFWVMAFVVAFTGAFQEELQRIWARTSDWVRRWGCTP
jgi:hypothetical protein